MRNEFRVFLFVLGLAGWAAPGYGQFLSLGGGALFSQDRSQPAPDALTLGSLARSDFNRSGLIAVDAGLPVAPFVNAGLHYSRSKPELFLRRGDAFGSSARVKLAANTLTFDARLRSPFIYGFRLYGLAGVGFTRFGLEVKEAVEVPFPGGAPDSVILAVVTYGGGVERRLRGLLHLKLEVRDYVSPIPDELFGAGGSWHRVAVIGGIVLGL